MSYDASAKRIVCDICGRSLAKTPWVGLNRYVFFTGKEWKMVHHQTWDEDGGKFTGPTLCLDHCLIKHIEYLMIELDGQNRKKGKGKP